MVKTGDTVVCVRNDWGPTNGCPHPKKDEIVHVIEIYQTGRIYCCLKEYPPKFGYDITYFEKVQDDYSKASSKLTKKLADKLKQTEKQPEIERVPQTA